jgi:hypothetical protein
MKSHLSRVYLDQHPSLGTIILKYNSAGNRYRLSRIRVNHTRGSAKVKTFQRAHDDSNMDSTKLSIDRSLRTVAETEPFDQVEGTGRLIFFTVSLRTVAVGRRTAKHSSLTDARPQRRAIRF